VGAHVSPDVLAAIIAASVSLLTLIGSLTVQLYGIRRNARGTDEVSSRQLVEQWNQLKTTLTAQYDQLEMTLEDQRARSLHERFESAADRLGTDRSTPVRLAAIYAMAALADDWPQKEGKQTCVEVLCGYLRMPYEPEPGADASAERRLAFQSDQQVRHTVIRVVAAHLQEGAPASWQGLNLDFTGVRFDGGDFTGARFSGGTANFEGAVFAGGTVKFGSAKFADGAVSFRRAVFAGGTVSFDFAVFSDAWVNFRHATFSGSKVDFSCADFLDGYIWFDDAVFSGGKIDFDAAKFRGSDVTFGGAQFSGASVDFSRVVKWTRPPTFDFADSPKPGVMLPAKSGASRPMRAALRGLKQVPNAITARDEGPAGPPASPDPARKRD
jgi:uncharacterized protein YjbI with pentapeptide repeats